MPLIHLRSLLLLLRRVEVIRWHASACLGLVAGLRNVCLRRFGRLAEVICILNLLNDFAWSVGLLVVGARCDPRVLLCRRLLRQELRALVIWILCCNTSLRWAILTKRQRPCTYRPVLSTCPRCHIISLRLLIGGYWTLLPLLLVKFCAFQPWLQIWITLRIVVHLLWWIDQVD